MSAPLTLKHYFFPNIEVSADPEWRPGEDNQPPRFSVKTSVVHESEKDLYQVALEIESSPETDEEKQAYIIHLVAIGLFSVQPDWPDPFKLLEVNGASMLYAAAREFIITVTARGPWPQVILPAISFLEQYTQRHSLNQEGN